VHETLAKMWTAAKFEPAITHIRFPLFKNLVPGTRIDFTHPVTAIVGPNGTNKSSILRALQGCPGSANLGVYWFGTALDAIPADQRHRFICGRLSETTNGTVEVIKTRIQRPAKRLPSGRIRREDPDYWEPSRALLGPADQMERYPYTRSNAPKDGSSTRWNPIDKRVVYLDFRSELSAFDWAFTHGSPQAQGTTPAQAQNNRKAHIRYWARRLKSALDRGLKTDVAYGLERIVEPARALEPEALAAVSAILGRDYDSVMVMRHRYFDKSDGWTAVMRSGALDYSEAFAGNGEFAAIMLVDSILRAPKCSLILLDEPEVSLHPAAQVRLMEFIAKQAQLHRHQIVLATHSPDIVRQLPPGAIKVLTIGRGGQVDLPSQASPAILAFEAVGAHFDKPTVAVEDELARADVEHAIQSESYATTIDVAALPGGAAAYWTRRLPTWAAEDRADVLLLLDGDQRCDRPTPSDEISNSALKATVKAALHGNRAQLLLNGGDKNVQTSDERTALRRVIDFRRRYVDFLPFDDPETYLWPHRINGSDTKSAGSNVKQQWSEHAKQTLGGRLEPPSSQILALQRQALAAVDDADPSLASIRATIAAFVEGLDS